MSGVPSRVAVQVGSRTVRIAGAAAEGDPWLVAELTGRAGRVDQLLAELIGVVPDELVVVHPPSWSASGIAALARDLGGLAGQVSTIPAPAAAAGRGERLVLDVGHTGSELTRLAADGSVQLCRTSPIGGAIMDEALVARLRSVVAEPGRGHVADATGCDHPPPLLDAARRLREQLSLLPVAGVLLPDRGRPIPVRATDAHESMADALRDLLDLLRAALPRDGPVPVLLIGGVARMPLLAELVDEVVDEVTAELGEVSAGSDDRLTAAADAGRPAVEVAPTPESASVLGALMPAWKPEAGPPISPAFPSAAARAPTPAHGCGRDPPVPVRRSESGPVDEQRRRSTGAASPGRSTTRFPSPRRRRLRAALLAGTGAALVAALLTLGSVLSPPSEVVSVPAGVLVQYGYRLDMPAEWAHTGGLPERRRVLLTRTSAPDGSDVIAVERTPLGYDGDAERSRALAELRAVFDVAVTTGSALSQFRIEQVGGREVASYRQRDLEGRTEVDWFVIIDGDAQLSVGCRYNPTTAGSVRAACAVVVGSVRRT